ncbi:MAG: hypothetical protein ABSF26_01200 [Thermoguttaceae bacterium]|jgi:hypothetical protein
MGGPVKKPEGWDNVAYQLEAAPQAKADAPPAADGPSEGDSPSFVGRDSGQSPPAAGKTARGKARADKARNAEFRSVDDVKSFFLKGLVQAQQKYGSKAADSSGKAGPGQSSGSGTRPGYGPSSGYGPGSASGYGSAKVKHNRIYTAAEIVQKFGDPASRKSETTLEHWVYKCKDGVVHVHFTEVGYAGGSSASKSETVRLEVKSVDSSSAPSAGGTRRME